ncbi:hypothetical protein SELMODRAFT_451452 [Selaginella moellendorffii]|uniref:Uncharacterized protein n=1 Tax=Selaginella moellendorffii TaxID=88036 RepID=D8SEZ8_SELML|nr:hypothetical protein SELMODRAFT_451452 [Selaginella moellendorffii]
MFGKCVQIGIPQILLILLISQYLKTLKASKKMPFLERFAIVIAVALTWAYAHWRLQAHGFVFHTHWNGELQLSTRAMRLGFLPVPLCHSRRITRLFSFLSKSTGSFYGIARLAGATPPPSYILSRGIGWQGVEIFINDIFGMAADPTISVENPGLVGTSQVWKTRDQFGGIFALIPAAMVAGIYCVLFGVLAASGVSYLQFTNLSLPRNLIILGFSVFMAGIHSRVYNLGWTRPKITLVIALIVGVVLDNILKLKVTKKDRGVNWWKNFRTFGADKRNEEFYKLLSISTSSFLQFD